MTRSTSTDHAAISCDGSNPNPQRDSPHPTDLTKLGEGNSTSRMVYRDKYGGMACVVLPKKHGAYGSSLLIFETANTTTSVSTSSTTDCSGSSPTQRVTQQFT